MALGNILKCIQIFCLVLCSLSLIYLARGRLELQDALVCSSSIEVNLIVNGLK